MVNHHESNTFRVSSAQLPPDGATSHTAKLSLSSSAAIRSASCTGVRRNKRMGEQEMDMEEQRRGMVSVSGVVDKK